MQVAELAAKLRGVGANVVAEESSVHVLYPQLGETLELDAQAVAAARPLVSPMGDPALEMHLHAAGDLRTVIVTADDIVFEPDPDQPTLSPFRMRVSNAPHLVAYSELTREMRHIHALCVGGRALDGNLDGVAGAFLLMRWFIDGALRIGLAPVEAISRWTDAWAAVEGDVALPGWPANERWSTLYVSNLPPEDVRPEPRSTEATLAEFRELDRKVIVSQLDDEFLRLWNRNVGESARAFYERITARLPPTIMEVWVYENSVGVELAVGEDVGFVRLRIVVSEQTLYLDEIRLSNNRPYGLFQKLLFAIESHCDKHGLTMRFLASEVGRYAFAAVNVFPADPDARRRAIARLKGE